jgi:hypothetical protein
MCDVITLLIHLLEIDIDFCAHPTEFNKNVQFVATKLCFSGF